MTEYLSGKYSRALAEVMLDSDRLEKAIASLLNIARVLDDADIKRFFLSPVIETETKLHVFDEVITAFETCREVTNCLKLLVQKNRIDLITDVATELEAHLNTKRELTPATIRTARSLSKDTRDQITRAVEGRIRKKITASFLEDSSLLGGFVAEIGHVVVDGSLKGFLDGLEKRLMD